MTRALGIDEKVFILGGVGPLASAKSARWIKEKLYGAIIPAELIDNGRLKSWSEVQQMLQQSPF